MVASMPAPAYAGGMSFCLQLMGETNGKLRGQFVSFHFFLVLIWVFLQKKGGPPKLSILIRFSIINHPFWVTLIFGNTHLLFSPQ